MITEPERSELFTQQTELVEDAVRRLDAVIKMLNRTMPLKAPEDWDFDRWDNANNELERAIGVWQATFKDWVIKAAEGDFQ